MKYFFSLIVALLLSVITVFAYDVSTSVQNKNVLLEEFTGIYCSYCPQGHAIAAKLKAAQPNNVYVIAVHSGLYSIPSPNDPYFSTDYGEMLHSEFEVSGYPSGMINRHAVNGYLVMSRGEWIEQAKGNRSEVAIVNLSAKSEYDADTRKLHVSVEGYYTGDSQQDYNLLNVAVVQNNLQGFQAGGGAGNAYMHQHVLRDYITENWGDTIRNVHQGDYFTRSYEYILPTQIHEVEVKPEDLEIIAFVCEGKTEVLNVTGSRLIGKNMSKPLGVILQQPNIPVKDAYGFNFFELSVENTSDKAIEEMDFVLTVNGETQPVKWLGNLPGFTRENIRIDASPYKMQDENSYEIILKTINGTEYHSENASVFGVFKAPPFVSSQLKIQLKTDYNAADNRFLLKDKDGNVVREFGPYASGSIQEYEETIDLDEGNIYCLEVSDIWADGIPTGFYKIFDDTDSLVFLNDNIGLYGDRCFFAIPATSAVTESVVSDNGFHLIQDGKFVQLLFGQSSLRRIQLRSLGGTLLIDDVVYSDSHVISLDALAKGVYLILVWDESGVTTRKILLGFDG